MQKSNRQLKFGLTLKEKDLFSLGRFYEGEFNRIPLAAAKVFGDEKEKKPQSVVITGPRESGKSHLLKGIAIKKRPAVKSAYIASAKLLLLPLAEMKRNLKLLAEYDIVCIDDIDLMEGVPAFYDELFHLFNELIQSGRFLAVTMKKSPAKADYLPDYLSTRLLSGMVVNIKRIGDDEKREVIKKLAADRQISITGKSIDYILENSPRSIGKLSQLIDKVESNIPAGAKSVGLHLIRRVVKSNENEETKR